MNSESSYCFLRYGFIELLCPVQAVGHENPFQELTWGRMSGTGVHSCYVIKEFIDLRLSLIDR